MPVESPAISRNQQRIIVLDTETTGFQPYDKIVTLAAMCIENDRVLTRSLYLVFDPRKDSHPDAIRVHGWDNWTTRFQDLFADHAAALHDWLGWADTLVMHNAEFDMHYLQREFRKAEHPLLKHRTDCTLQRARGRWPGQKCGLDECAERIGIAPRQGHHCALEDVFLTTALYLHGRGVTFSVPAPPRWPDPTNFHPPEPRPPGPLPRRSPKHRSLEAFSAHQLAIDTNNVTYGM